MLIRKKIVKVVAEHFFLIIRVFVWLCVFRYVGMIDGGGNSQFRFLSRREGGMVRPVRGKCPFQLAQEIIAVCMLVGMGLGVQKDDVVVTGRFGWDGKVIGL